jgi:two-component system CheB/CheR fusion protein
VILSGTGSDGTLGMAEIQAQGGVTFAQSEGTAKYDGMPRSAIASGCVDYVLAPREIAHELERIAHHPYVGRDQMLEKPEVVSRDGAGLSVIFQLLRRGTGLDFTHYRQTTILRRVHRRMMVHKIEKLDDYVKYVQTNPSEIRALYQDMLINVTSFFRNPAVFEAMKTSVLPNILKNRQREGSIRVWTPGCSTGEETYSLAITLLEYLGAKNEQASIQFFGTDVSEASVAKARAGVYPENIQGDVSPERLRKYFTRVDSRYRISKNIRDMCIFAQHNILNDPPFSQMDIICCRNLLIYLEPVLQSKVIALFNYAIRNGGYLILGTSEGVGTATPLFSCEDRTHKIFSKKASVGRQVVTFSLDRQADRNLVGGVRVPGKAESGWNHLEAQKEFDRRLLAQHTPAAAFINEDMEIIHTRGNVTRYLKLAPGRASLNILKMVREGLLLDLRNAISRCKKEMVPVQKHHVQMKSGNGNGNGNDKDKASAHHSREVSRLVDIEVAPVTVGNVKEPYFMIVFHDSPEEAPRKGARAKSSREAESTTRQIVKLEEELAATKEYLQSVIETQEATNEELQSANEEILSSNEELQSTNEELETAKEELQSANEELSTVNDELRNRNLEITHVNSDLTNLFAEIDVAVVLVGNDLMIRRFTPKAQKILGLIPGDIGRSLLNIKPTLDVPDLHTLVTGVISSGQLIEHEVKDKDHTRYHLRIFPYRTPEGNKTEGAVITVVSLATGHEGKSAGQS